MNPWKGPRLNRMAKFHGILFCRRFKKIIIPPAKKKLSLIVQWTDRTCPLDLILWEPVIWNADFIYTNDKLYEMILTPLNVIPRSLFRINSTLIYPRHILRIIGFSISKQALVRTKIRSTVSKNAELRVETKRDSLVWNVSVWEARHSVTNKTTTWMNPSLEDRSGSYYWNKMSPVKVLWDLSKGGLDRELLFLENLLIALQG